MQSILVWQEALASHRVGFLAEPFTSGGAFLGWHLGLLSVVGGTTAAYTAGRLVMFQRNGLVDII